MNVQFRNKTYYLTAGAGMRHESKVVFCPPHRHDFIEFVYMLRGSASHTVDGKSYRIKQGDMLVINYGQTHSIDVGAGTFINIFLKPEYISESLTDRTNAFALLELAEFSDFRKTLGSIKNLVTFGDFERQTVENIIMNLEIELKQLPAGSDLSARSWFNLLLVMIFRKMTLLQQTTFEGLNEAVLEYVKAHCHEKLEMAKVAAMCHYNPSYFSRAFKAFAGSSFTVYVKNARMERAMLLLSTTGMRISELSHETGYTDTTKFFRDFREYTGITPGEYRQSAALKK